MRQIKFYAVVTVTVLADMLFFDLGTPTVSSQAVAKGEREVK
jgi:hypothetical protein